MADETSEMTLAEQAKRNKKLKLNREREVQELRDVLSKPAGRAVIWRLISECGVYGSAPLIAAEMMRFEGGRDIGLQLINECFISDPHAYNRMRDENIIREEDLNDGR